MEVHERSLPGNSRYLRQRMNPAYGPSAWELAPRLLAEFRGHQHFTPTPTGRIARRYKNYVDCYSLDCSHPGHQESVCQLGTEFLTREQLLRIVGAIVGSGCGLRSIYVPILNRWVTAECPLTQADLDLMFPEDSAESLAS